MGILLVVCGEDTASVFTLLVIQQRRERLSKQPHNQQKQSIIVITKPEERYSTT